MIKKITTKMCPPKNSQWTPAEYDEFFLAYTLLQPELDRIALECDEKITGRTNDFENHTCSFTAEFSDCSVLILASFKIGICLGLNGLNFDVECSVDFSLMEKCFEKDLEYAPI